MKTASTAWAVVPQMLKTSIVRAVVTMMVVLGMLSCGSSGSNSPAPSIGSANTFYPHSEGSTWSYLATSPTGSTYTAARTFVQSSSTSATLKWTFSNQTTYELQYTDFSDGLAVSGYNWYNADNSLVSSTSYSPPELIGSSTMSPGHTASSSSTVIQTQNGSAPTGTLIRSIVVHDSESVTVPAGTFSAIKVTATTTSTPLSGPQVQTAEIRWYVLGVGWVKRITYPLTSPAATTTFELSSYTIVP